MHRLITDVLEGKIENGYLIGRLNSAIEWVESLPVETTEVKTKKKLNEPSSQEIRDVFEYWQKVTGRPKTRLTADKKKHISGRLREGFSVKDLCKVIDWSQTDPWFQGENPSGKKYDYIDNLFRNSSKVEKRLEEFDKQSLGKTEGPSSRLEELRERSEIALSEGRIEEYNEIENAIRSIQKTNQSK
jgi:uncharacterized phage protein (TIGR02220 family)